MKRGIVFVALVAAVAIVLAGPALAGKPTETQTKPLTAKGMVMSWEPGKMLKIRDDSGKDMTFEVSAKTQTKGTPTAGEMIVVHYRVHEAKNLATALVPWAPTAAMESKAKGTKPPMRPTPKPASATQAPPQPEKK